MTFNYERMEGFKLKDTANSMAQMFQSQDFVLMGKIGKKYQMIRGYKATDNLNEYIKLLEVLKQNKDF